MTIEKPARLAVYVHDLATIRSSTWAVLEDVTQTVKRLGAIGDSQAASIAYELAALLVAIERVTRAIKEAQS